MLRKTLLLLAAVAVTFASAATGYDAPPPALQTKNVRLDVNFHDVQGLVFDATLWQIAPATTPAIRDYLNYHLDYEFEVDVGSARCFVASAATPCKDVAALLDEVDGGLDATILARAVLAKDGTVSFQAKKLTVWLSSGDEPPSEEGTPPPVPPKFFTKNHRLNVNLNDVEGSLFDASLYDFPASTPARVQAYLWWHLEASFDLDAEKASCYVIKRDTVSSVACSDIAAIVDGWLDPIYASVLAKPYLDADGELAFKAKKITIWL